MKLIELVELATSLDPIFAQKMNYWIVKRKKVPELQYMIKHCERILGGDFVEEQARKHLKLMEEENNG